MYVWFSENESMRKRIIPFDAVGRTIAAKLGLAGCRATGSKSKSLPRNPAAPIEVGVSLGPRTGRAAEPGTQQIRLMFDPPQRLQRIWLRFVECATERTQEFILRYSEPERSGVKEIVRQQWNFSPARSTSETEDYQVDLPQVSMLEMWLEPDQGKGFAFAGLAEWRLA